MLPFPESLFCLNVTVTHPDELKSEHTIPDNLEPIMVQEHKWREKYGRTNILSGRPEQEHFPEEVVDQVQYTPA